MGFKALSKGLEIRRSIVALIPAILLSQLFCQDNAFSADRATIIAVASNSDQASSLVGRDPVHSDYYLIFADTGELLDVLDNPSRGGGRGAGIRVADFLAQHRIDVVVAEYFSPALIRAVEARGIRPVVFKGLAREAVLRIAPGIERK